MIAEHGVAMVTGMVRPAGAYWTRALGGQVIDRYFWLFEE